MVTSPNRDWNINDTIGLLLDYSGYEDYQRYLSDHKNTHEERTKVFRNGKIEDI